ncbi:hypothetical protein NUSPORA_01055 [Nucleospora cyclopteri]
MSNKNKNLLTNNNFTEKSAINNDFSPIDKSTLESLCNPAAAAFCAALDDLKKNPDKGIVDEIHMTMLIDGSQYNNKILERLHELLEFLSFNILYVPIIMVFIDISHYNKEVQLILKKHKIFTKLDFSQEITFELVFNLCDGNREMYGEYMKVYEESHGKNEKIKKLQKLFN